MFRHNMSPSGLHRRWKCENEELHWEHNWDGRATWSCYVIMCQAEGYLARRVSRNLIEGGNYFAFDRSIPLYSQGLTQGVRRMQSKQSDKYTLQKQWYPYFPAYKSRSLPDVCVGDGENHLFKLLVNKYQTHFLRLLCHNHSVWYCNELWRSPPPFVSL